MRTKPIDMMDADQLASHVRSGQISRDQAKAAHHGNTIRAMDRRIADAERVEQERQSEPALDDQSFAAMIARIGGK